MYFFRSLWLLKRFKCNFKLCQKYENDLTTELYIYSEKYRLFNNREEKRKKLREKGRNQKLKISINSILFKYYARIMTREIFHCYKWTIIIDGWKYKQFYFFYLRKWMQGCPCWLDNVVDWARNKDSSSNLRRRVASRGWFKVETRSTWRTTMYWRSACFTFT